MKFNFHTREFVPRRLERSTAKVYFNGRKLEHCWRADEEQDIACTYATNENGHCYRDGDKIAENPPHFGKVEIKEA